MDNNNTNNKNGLSQTVKAKEARKLKEKYKAKKGFWYGLGMFGLIGWSIAVPTFLGTLLGIWLDKHTTGKQSWTLSFLLIGLILGCITVWLWLSKENKEIHKEEDKNE